MNIEAYKNQIIKKLLDVQDENLLAEIEAILDLNPFVIQTLDGKSLSKSEYIEHIESISESVVDGAATYTSEEFRNHILPQKK
jgi:hypothetical protein